MTADETENDASILKSVSWNSRESEPTRMLTHQNPSPQTSRQPHPRPSDFSHSQLLSKRRPNPNHKHSRSSHPPIRQHNLPRVPPPVRDEEDASEGVEREGEVEKERDGVEEEGSSEAESGGVEGWREDA